jgi:hypothetical protein
MRNEPSASVCITTRLRHRLSKYQGSIPRGDGDFSLFHHIQTVYATWPIFCLMGIVRSQSYVTCAKDRYLNRPFRLVHSPYQTAIGFSVYTKLVKIILFVRCHHNKTAVLKRVLFRTMALSNRGNHSYR